MFIIGGKADIAPTCAVSANDPTQTLPALWRLSDWLTKADVFRALWLRSEDGCRTAFDRGFEGVT